MSDQEKKKNKGDLIDIKSLIGDADGGGYSLDDIMAEYGHPTQPEPPRKWVPHKNIPEAAWYFMV